MRGRSNDCGYSWQQVANDSDSRLFTRRTCRGTSCAPLLLRDHASGAPAAAGNTGLGSILTDGAVCDTSGGWPSVVPAASQLDAAAAEVTRGSIPYGNLRRRRSPPRIWAVEGAVGVTSTSDPARVEGHEVALPALDVRQAPDDVVVCFYRAVVRRLDGVSE